MEKEKTITFKDCINECIAQPEFIYHFDRLNGFHNRSPLEKMIDEQTGYYQETLLNFIYEYIWMTFKNG